jgi:ankyrin repeat protein
VNARDKDGSTSILFTAKKGHLPCLEILIQNNADVNARNK